MVSVDGLGRYESITTLVRRHIDCTSPRLNICSIDILYDTRYSEIIDASRGFVFRVLLQHSGRNFGSQQVVTQCWQGLFMLRCEQVFCGGVKRLSRM
jgi:hypothetical protein